MSNLSDQDFTDLAMALIDKHNADTDEFNELCTALDDERAENERLKHNNQILVDKLASQSQELKTLKADLKLAIEGVSASDKIIKNAEQIKAVSEQNFLMLKQARIELNKLTALNPKRLQAKVKGQKADLTAKAETITALRKELAKYIQDAKHKEQEFKRLELDVRRAVMTTVYSKEGHALAIWPYMERHQFVDAKGNKLGEVKQCPLLYLNEKGKGKLLMLNTDGEIDSAPSREINPPAEVMDIAKAWLNEAGRRNWILSDSLLTMLS